MPSVENQSSPSPNQPQSAAAVALDPVRLLRTYWPWLSAALLVGVVAGVALFVALNIFMPRYRATAVYETQPVFTPDFELIGSNAAGEEAEVFMQTQVFLLRSDRLLDLAVQEPSVQSTDWYKQYVRDGGFDRVEALDDLKDIVGARVLPNTALFSLTVSLPSPSDAATIAQAICTVYENDYNSVRTGDVSVIRRNIERQISNLRLNQRSFENQLEVLLVENQLESTDITESSFYRRLAILQAELVPLRAELTSNRRQLQEYQLLLNQEGTPVYPEPIRAQAKMSQVAQRLEAEIEIRRATLEGLRQTTGPNAQSVTTAEAQLQAFENRYEEVINLKMQETLQNLVQQFKQSIAASESTELNLLEEAETARVQLNQITQNLKQYAEIESELELVLDQISNARQRLDEINMIGDVGSRIRRVQAATPPDIKSFPKIIPVVVGVMFLFTGAVAGFIVVKELREQRVRTPRDISLIPRTRVLGILPELSMDPAEPDTVETAVTDEPFGAVAESARQIRTAIFKACDQRGHKSILFTSGMPGSGTTTVISNVAAAASSVESRVLIIDANLRRPAIHKVFKLNPGPGLAEVIRGDASLSDAVQRTQHGFEVLSAGAKRGHEYEKFNTSVMQQLLEEAGSQYDLILIDTPPAVVAADALSLAARTDASVLVCRAYSEKRGLIQRLRNQLADAKGDFLGVVVNGVRASAGGYMKANFKASMSYQNYNDAT